jgi:glutamate:GABA antiporter
VLGWLCAVVFIWVLLASGSSWIMGAGRSQAAACLDGAGPPALGRISARTGVPVVMALVSGGVSMLTMLVNLSITGGDAQKYFSATLTTAIALIVLAYMLIFPAFVALRLKRPYIDRPFRVPGGLAVAWIVSISATAWSALATLCLVWPGFGTIDPDASLPAGFAHQRVQFELLVLLPIAFVVLLACIFHQLGRCASR